MEMTMTPGRFMREQMGPEHPHWNQAIERYRQPNTPGGVSPLLSKYDDIRTPFYRDYTRILHCTPYRRLKHKTQVFFATQNDHVCTRMEHVNHVASISYTIAKYLGLNVELTQAISLGHDLGHSPFGHEGESLLNDLTQQWGQHFWHEQNGLYTADKIATLPDDRGIHKNLRLTYAVRDGIISHCGETDDNGLFPRQEAVDLATISQPNQYQPYTWEACVVKLSDKIAYLGRDIEDAIELNLLEPGQLDEMRRLVASASDSREVVNNTTLIQLFITDLCKHSSPENGLHLSHKYHDVLVKVKSFNYRHIYGHPRLAYYKDYAKCVIDTIFKFLDSFYTDSGLLETLAAQRDRFPTLLTYFRQWLVMYGNLALDERTSLHQENQVIYDLHDRTQYRRAIIDYMAGMTDNFAIRVYNEIISF